MPDQAFSLFISYAHKNEHQKNRLLTALVPLKRTGLIQSWDDRRICAGDDWRQEIDSAMEKADGAIFLLCENFLASDFCMANEVENFLQRYRQEKLLILFVLGDHCGWDEFDYISRFQMAPRDGRPITSYSPHSKAYTLVKDEIKQALLDHREKHGLTPKTAPPAAASPTHDEYQTLLAKLPGQTEQLFGREDELALLDQWRDHHGVFVWVAEGGMGKSALLRNWLEQRDWPAATRFLGHSFYSQGSRDQTTNARGFITAALQQLGESFDNNSNDYSLGQRLAQAAAQQPCVILLDGLEPLQHASKTDTTLHSTLKDQGIVALLEGLGQTPGEALCLVSTRIKLNDPTLRDALELRQRALKQLTLAGAEALLAYRSVGGTEDERAQVAKQCGHHPLSLILAAEFIHTFAGGEAAALLEREWPTALSANADEHHAATIMAWFDAELADEQQALDRELMGLVGLFDRPAPWAALQALQSAAPIPGLTTELHDADAERLWDALARLRQWGLLHYAVDEAEPELDAHPLVREHFGQLLAKQNPAGYRAAHKVLFDFFRNLPEKEQPDTLEEMEPLYRAMGHGCRAGQYQATREEVYRDRICRGNQGYNAFQLGAYSSDLAALAGFFPHGWNSAPVKSGLSESNRSWLIAEVAFCLMSLGRLEEAVGPRRVGMAREKKTEDWANFCISSEGLGDLYTPLGRWAEAEAVAREAATAAQRIDAEDKRQARSMVAQSYLGRALHNRGRLTEAGEAFLQAEAVQKKRQPANPRLFSVPGFDYGQLLQEQARDSAAWQTILERGRYSLEIFQRQQHLLSIALDHSTIGQALAALAQPGAGQALYQAVETMRRAGSANHLPKMHLARGHYHRDQGDSEKAWADHAAALATAQRGKMRTFLADCALLAANLHLDQKALPDAAKAWAEGELIIRETGYGRRLTELHLLEARLRHHQNNPQAAAQAFKNAEARIREIGQWGFWPTLHGVGQEIGSETPGYCPSPQ